MMFLNLYLLNQHIDTQEETEKLVIVKQDLIIEKEVKVG